MQLRRENLKHISQVTNLVLPDQGIFSLPEKVLQFGTGVLLRALPDYFIDKANRLGAFNGRVVAVKSTTLGNVNEFAEQDNLYTLCLRGIENDRRTEEFIINSSLSRVVSANHDWDLVLKCAHDQELRLIISNTTEVGITLTDDKIHQSPPHSFPGKLLSFLFERYRTFGGNPQNGMIIIPTELIPANGDTLRSILLELAVLNKLDDNFVDWLKTANHFCNSLVDRIVPGKLPTQEQAMIEQGIGYNDNLMIMAETFCLWAIECHNEVVSQALSFSGTNPEVVITGDIEVYRELKLRLLNGTHTFVCGLALLAGFTTVKEAMNHPQFASFVNDLAIHEIVNAVTNSKISYDIGVDFARKTLERFRNPFLEHRWLSIATQYSQKMKLRNVPLLLQHYGKGSQVPIHMALGFAAFILFMKYRDELRFLVEDEQAARFTALWSRADANAAPDIVVDEFFSDDKFWGTDLSLLNGFRDEVKADVVLMSHEGVMAAIEKINSHKMTR